VARPREPWRREQLLGAAVEVASTVGLGNLTIKDVAGQAGVAPSTIHYHFSDIEGVMLGIVERSLEQMYDQRLVAIHEVPDIVSKLRTLIELGVPDQLSHEVALMYEAIAVMRSREYFDTAVRSYIERQVSLYRSVIDSGISTGVFAPTEPAEVISRNLVALEDAYDLYRVVGASRDGTVGRRNILVYASRALGCELPGA
jgi:AcrR family transcriptional regulator